MTEWSHGFRFILYVSIRGNKSLTAANKAITKAHVHISSPYIYRIYGLTKFTKKSEKNIQVFFILLYLCIKFQF
jgi:hypothetical protein